jgi:hypothetical protein
MNAIFTHQPRLMSQARQAHKPPAGEVKTTDSQLLRFGGFDPATTATQNSGSWKDTLPLLAVLVPAGVYYATQLHRKAKAMALKQTASAEQTSDALHPQTIKIPHSTHNPFKKSHGAATLDDGKDPVPAASSSHPSGSVKDTPSQQALARVQKGMVKSSSLEAMLSAMAEAEALSPRSSATSKQFVQLGENDEFEVASLPNSPFLSRASSPLPLKQDEDWTFVTNPH